MQDYDKNSYRPGDRVYDKLSGREGFVSKTEELGGGMIRVAVLFVGAYAVHDYFWKKGGPSIPGIKKLKTAIGNLNSKIPEVRAGIDAIHSATPPSFRYTGVVEGESKALLQGLGAEGKAALLKALADGDADSVESAYQQLLDDAVYSWMGKRGYLAKVNGELHAPTEALQHLTEIRVTLRRKLDELIRRDVGRNVRTDVGSAVHRLVVQQEDQLREALRPRGQFGVVPEIGQQFAAQRENRAARAAAPLAENIGGRLPAKRFSPRRAYGIFRADRQAEVAAVFGADRAYLVHERIPWPIDIGEPQVGRSFGTARPSALELYPQVANQGVVAPELPIGVRGRSTAVPSGVLESVGRELIFDSRDRVARPRERVWRQLSISATLDHKQGILPGTETAPIPLANYRQRRISAGRTGRSHQQLSLFNALPGDQLQLFEATREDYQDTSIIGRAERDRIYYRRRLRESALARRFELGEQLVLPGMENTRGGVVPRFYTLGEGHTVRWGFDRNRYRSRAETHGIIGELDYSSYTRDVGGTFRLTNPERTRRRQRFGPFTRDEVDSFVSHRRGFVRKQPSSSFETIQTLEDQQKILSAMLYGKPGLPEVPGLPKSLAARNRKLASDMGALIRGRNLGYDSDLVSHLAPGIISGELFGGYRKGGPAGGYIGSLLRIRQNEIAHPEFTDYTNKVMRQFAEVLGSTDAGEHQELIRGVAADLASGDYAQQLGALARLRTSGDELADTIAREVYKRLQNIDVPGKVESRATTSQLFSEIAGIVRSGTPLSGYHRDIIAAGERLTGLTTITSDTEPLFNIDEVVNTRRARLLAVGKTFSAEDEALVRSQLTRFISDGGRDRVASAIEQLGNAGSLPGKGTSFQSSLHRQYERIQQQLEKLRQENARWDTDVFGFMASIAENADGMPGWDIPADSDPYWETQELFAQMDDWATRDKRAFAPTRSGRSARRMSPLGYDRVSIVGGLEEFQDAYGRLEALVSELSTKNERLSNVFSVKMGHLTVGEVMERLEGGNAPGWSTTKYQRLLEDVGKTARETRIGYEGDVDPRMIIASRLARMAEDGYSVGDGANSLVALEEIISGFTAADYRAGLVDVVDKNDEMISVLHSTLQEMLGYGKDAETPLGALDEARLKQLDPTELRRVLAGRKMSRSTRTRLNRLLDQGNILEEIGGRPSELVNKGESEASDAEEAAAEMGLEWNAPETNIGVEIENLEGTNTGDASSRSLRGSISDAVVRLESRNNERELQSTAEAVLEQHPSILRTGVSYEDVVSTADFSQLGVARESHIASTRDRLLSVVNKLEGRSNNLIREALAEEIEEILGHTGIPEDMGMRRYKLAGVYNTLKELTGDEQLGSYLSSPELKRIIDSIGTSYLQELKSYVGMVPGDVYNRLRTFMSTVDLDNVNVPSAVRQASTLLKQDRRHIIDIITPPNEEITKAAASDIDQYYLHHADVVSGMAKRHARLLDETISENGSALISPEQEDMINVAQDLLDSSNLSVEDKDRLQRAIGALDTNISRTDGYLDRGATAKAFIDNLNDVGGELVYNDRGFRGVRYTGPVRAIDVETSAGGSITEAAIGDAEKTQSIIVSGLDQSIAAQMANSGALDPVYKDEYRIRRFGQIVSTDVPYEMETVGDEIELFRSIAQRMADSGELDPLYVIQNAKFDYNQLSQRAARVFEEAARRAVGANAEALRAEGHEVVGTIRKALSRSADLMYTSRIQGNFSSALDVLRISQMTADEFRGYLTGGTSIVPHEAGSDVMSTIRAWAADQGQLTDLESIGIGKGYLAGEGRFYQLAKIGRDPISEVVHAALAEINPVDKAATGVYDLTATGTTAEEALSSLIDRGYRPLAEITERDIQAQAYLNLQREMVESPLRHDPSISSVLGSSALDLIHEDARLQASKLEGVARAQYVRDYFEALEQRATEGIELTFSRTKPITVQAASSVEATLRSKNAALDYAQRNIDAMSSFASEYSLDREREVKSDITRLEAELKALSEGNEVRRRAIVEALGTRRSELRRLRASKMAGVRLANLNTAASAESRGFLARLINSANTGIDNELEVADAMLAQEPKLRSSLQDMVRKELYLRHYAGMTTGDGVDVLRGRINQERGGSVLSNLTPSPTTVIFNPNLTREQASEVARDVFVRSQRGGLDDATSRRLFGAREVDRLVSENIKQAAATAQILGSGKSIHVDNERTRVILDSMRARSYDIRRLIGEGDAEVATGARLRLSEIASRNKLSGNWWENIRSWDAARGEDGSITARLVNLPKISSSEVEYAVGSNLSRTLTALLGEIPDQQVATAEEAASQQVATAEEAASQMAEQIGVAARNTTESLAEKAAKSAKNMKALYIAGGVIAAAAVVGGINRHRNEDSPDVIRGRSVATVPGASIANTNIEIRGEDRMGVSAREIQRKMRHSFFSWFPSHVTVTDGMDRVDPDYVEQLAGEYLDD